MTEGALDADLERRLDAYVRERGPRLYRTAYLLTGDGASAEDLVQTALASLLVSWRRLRGIDNLDAYMHRSIVNAARRRWLLAGREVPLEHLPDREVPDGSGRFAQYDYLLQALRALPPKQRAAIVLRYYEDMSEADIAHILQCSPGTVRSQVSRGLAGLRHLLDPAPDGPEELRSHREAQPAHRHGSGHHRRNLRPKFAPVDPSGEVKGGRS